MTRTIKMSAVALLCAAGLSLAQTLPPAPPRGPGDESRPKDAGPRGEGEDGQRPGGEGRDGMRPRGPRDGMGPGGPLGPGGPGGPGMRNPVEAMKQYLDLVNKYTELAKDPSATSVSAVVTLAELAKQKSPSDAIERLNKLLGETKDAAVQRAIRLQLVDLYKSSNQIDKAIEQAEILIRGQ